MKSHLACNRHANAACSGDETGQRFRAEDTFGKAALVDADGRQQGQFADEAEFEQPIGVYMQAVLWRRARDRLGLTEPHESSKED